METAKLSKSKIFLYACIAFILGVGIASFLPKFLIEDPFIYFLFLMINFLLLIFCLNFSSEDWRIKFVYRPGIIFFLGLFLFCGMWRYVISEHQVSPENISYYNDEKIEMSGIICDEVIRDTKKQRFEFCVRDIKRENKNFKTQGKVLLTARKYPRYNYGEKLKVNCNLEKVGKFRGFDYDHYLARFNIYSLCYYPRIEKINFDLGFFEETLIDARKKILDFKKNLSKYINYGLDSETAGLASAMILGDKKNINDELRDRFAQIGISHVIAISGMHISILSGIVMLLLLSFGFSRQNSFFLASGFLIFYIILIGIPASALRAGLMGFLLLLSINLGRMNKIYNALFFVCFLMLLINPRLLRDDIGFELSFLAVLGIVYWHPFLGAKFQKINESNKFIKIIVEIFIASLAVQIFTLPILVYNFKQISLISPISNLLIVWILPPLMIAILVGIILSFLVPSLGFIWFLPAGFLLKYIIICANFLAKLPYAYFEFRYVSGIWFWIYLILISFLMMEIKNKK